MAGNIRANPSSTRSADPPISVPIISRLAGLRVGVDTIETMEASLGPGRQYTGEHAHGAREWRLAGAGWLLEGDGFDYKDNERRVLDTLDLAKDTGYVKHSNFDTPMATPKIRVSRRKVAWMGVVYPGMTSDEVLRVVGGMLQPPKVKAGVWEWKARGFVRVNRANNETYTYWTADVHFNSGRVSEILVYCS